VEKISKQNPKEATMSDRDEFGAFLVGFIVGGLTGAVVALLFAPQSGEETRALIKDKSIELRDKAQQSAEEALARAEQVAQEARARADELAKQVKERGTEVYSTARERGQAIYDDVRERGKTAVESLRKGKKNEGEESAAA
jgi:gas vesicle protein